MKRLVLVLALICLPALALAEESDRDMLLTDAGVLFTIESDDATNHEIAAAATKLLKLTIAQGDDESTTYVPASLLEGSHSTPSLAYDPGSKTLFVFWQNEPNRMSSELLFCSYQNGEWSETTSIDNGVFRHRRNLRIALTSYYTEVSGESSEPSVKPGKNLHAVWWEVNGATEMARYAMLSLDNGDISSIQIRDLHQFIKVGRADGLGEIDLDYPIDLLRHPAILDVPSRDAVEIVFADWGTKQLNRVKVRPIKADGVLTVPDGVWGGGMRRPRFAANAAGRVSVLPGPENDSLLLYYHSERGLTYTLYKNEDWNEEKTLVLGEKISREVGVNVLRRLVESE